MRKVSLKDIAKKAGASPSAVSFVLNGKDKQMRIGADLADRIRAIAQTEGYRPNQVAVSLRTGKSNIIGLVVDTISGHFFASLARNIESELEHVGYRVIYCSTGNDSRKASDLIHMLYHYQVDGFLITPMPGIESEVERLAASGKPVVLIDSYFPQLNLPHVLVNNYDGIAKAVLHLLDKGYTEIGFVYNDVDLVQMQERKRAYVETLEANGQAVKKGMMLQTKLEWEAAQGVDVIARFIETARPQAVVFAANYLGLYGLEAVKKLGLKIPSDLAIVCFDDHELFRLYQPEVTAIQQPIPAIAKKAVELLLLQMDAGNEGNFDRHVQIKGKLIERLST